MFSTSNLSDMHRLQFMAANYGRLQGLRGLPIGSLTLLVALWANFDRGPAPRPVLPYILFALFALIGMALIDRYYSRSFGNVIGNPAGHLSWVVSLVGGSVALLAFLFDTRFQLPVSLTGLVFAVSMLADYLFLVGITRVWYMPLMPVFPLIVALFSASSLLGMDAWWKVLGFRAEILAVVMVAGLMILLVSLLSHFYFIHMLPGKFTNGTSI